MRMKLTITIIIIIIIIGSSKANYNDDINNLERLIINIKNGGGDVYREIIVANTTDDTIELEFRDSDGSHVTQLIDFKSDVQILRVMRLGEQHLGESVYQIYCFVINLPHNEFITSDAMSKLRQRNPTAIREAEEDKGTEIYEMDLNVHLHMSSIISPHIPKLCNAAYNTTYAREIDLRSWAGSKVLNRDIISLTSSVHKLPNSKTVRCNVIDPQWKSCKCHIQMCIPWYPCALKYCRGRDSTNGKTLNYRCGIRTCRKCRDLHFHVKHKQQCLWNLFI